MKVKFTNENIKIDQKDYFLMIVINLLDSKNYKIPVWHKFNIPIGGSKEISINLKNITVIVSYEDCGRTSLSSPIIPLKSKIYIQDSGNSLKFSEPVNDELLGDNEISVVNNSNKSNVNISWGIDDCEFATMENSFLHSAQTKIQVEKNIYLSIGNIDYFYKDQKSTADDVWTKWVPVSIEKDGEGLNVNCSISSTTNEPTFKVGK